MGFAFNSLTGQLDLVGDGGGPVTGSPNEFARFDSAGLLTNVPGWSFNQATSEVAASLGRQPAGESGFYQWQNSYLTFSPTANSPGQTWASRNTSIAFDTASSGFSQGTNGTAAMLDNYYFTHLGTGNVGQLVYQNMNAELGNGVDPISIKGLSFVQGYAEFKANVTIDGPIQGYISAIRFNSASITSASHYNNTFADFNDMPIALGNYQSFSATPQLGSIKNNSGYTGVNLAANITTFTGNAGYTGVGISPNIVTMNTGGFNGISISPNITSCIYATGIRVDMSSVNASGSKRAADFNGNCDITGYLNVTGNFNTSFETNPIDLGGAVSVGNSLNTTITALANVTTANVDTFGTIIPMNVVLRANSINTSTPFNLGFTSSGFVSVVETQSGSSLDFLSAGTFAINFLGTSTGGTIDRVTLCRALSVPNGITVVNELIGFHAQAPFGDVGTDSWGFYVDSAGANNYFANRVRIGVGSDKVSAGQALEVVGKVQLNGNIGFFGVAESAQQAGAAATAGAAYTVTEQAMIQTVYNALRTYGLLN